MSEKVLISQTRNGFFNSAAISFPLPTPPITADVPGHDAFCVPVASHFAPKVVCGHFFREGN